MTYHSHSARGNEPVTPGPPAPMSPPQPPPPEPLQPPGKRPATVTGAAVLMTFMTIVVTGSAVLLMYAILSMDAQTTGPEDARALWWFRAVAVGVGTAYMLVGLGVLGLATAVLRGRNWARVMTFCVYAVFILCAGIGELGALGGTESLASMNGAVTTEDITFSVAITMVFGTQMLTMAVTILLLALPISNRWFKAYTRARAAGLM